jgi:hypothetical protein
MGADRGMGSLAGGASGALQGTRFLLSSQAAVSSRGGAPQPPDAARPDVKQPSGDRRYRAPSHESPWTPDMEERTVALGHGRLPRIRADVQRGSKPRFRRPRTHDAPNDSQMILSFTGHPLTVACLGQLGTNGSMASLSSILLAPKAGATPQRSLQLQMLDATPRLMTGSLRLYASRCSQGPGPPSPEHRLRPGSTWNGNGPRSEPPGPRGLTTA